jgi:ABC-type uncharacterized transport system permease subunit
MVLETNREKLGFAHITFKKFSRNYRLLNFVDFENNSTRARFSTELAKSWSAFAASISNYIQGLGFIKVRDMLYKDCEAVNMIKSCYAIYVFHQVKIEFLYLFQIQLNK